MTEKQLIKRFGMGNEAITEGAIAAGATFYAGYPITPSSEVAELSSIMLPKHGGKYVQMEDELGSMAAIIGASCAGAKSYTATSGPGFSLMQENFGLGCMAEIPCVVIDVQRSGPSTGLATKPAQGDFMQAQYGTHGDHGVIALAPASVQECFDLTVEAFNLAEEFRTPVVLLADEIIAHLRETYTIDPNIKVVNRKKPDFEHLEGDYLPYDFEHYEDEIVPLAAYGAPKFMRVNGSTHGPSGAATADPVLADKSVRHLTNKFRKNIDRITRVKKFGMEDAEIVIIAFGCSVRSAQAAMRIGREKGMKIGVLQLVTIWPFPEKQVREALQQAKQVIVPELNLGQLILQVNNVNDYGVPVVGVNRVDSLNITPYQILETIQEA